MNRCGIGVAFVTAEYLYDTQRALIAGTFGCRVANGYGGRDAGFIAHECPQGRLHLSAEDILVEIVDGSGNVLAPGASGEIVVTHTATPDFPFIRYRTGDIGRFDTRPCPCGRTLPVLGEVQGRSTDFVMAADGTLMHGLALIYVVRDVPGVCAFKIIQEDRLRTRIQLVTDAGFDEAAIAGIVAQTRARLGQTVQVDIERVGSIPPAASGKYRYVESRVASAAG
jgi:phenylacetate-CoA ligase